MNTISSKKSRLYITSFFLVLFFGGCNDRSIKIQRVRKNPAPVTPNQSGQKTHQPDIHWETPTHWTELPATKMRLASFEAVSSNKKKVDISVSFLTGDGGGDLMNVNRWRGQIGLDNISPSELDKDTDWIRHKNKNIRLVNYTGSLPMTDESTRIIAAIYPQGTHTWFFKMMGEKNAVAEQEATFRSWLKTLEFHDAH